MTGSPGAGAPARGLLQHARFPLGLLAALLAGCVATLIAPPAGRTSRFLEVTPGLLMVLALIVSYRRVPLSHWV